MTKDEILKSLRGAKAHIRKFGWTQRLYGDKKSSCCAVGAMVVGAGLRPKDICPVELPDVENAFKKANGFTGTVESWNDQYGRTKAQVIAALDKTIAAVKARKH